MIKNYRDLASEYASSVNTKSYNAYYERPIMLDLVGDVKDKEILELGCSTGFYTNELTKMGANVLGVDGSKEMLAYAKEINPTLNFKCFDLNDTLDYPKRFDIVFASLVVHYIKDLRKLYSELYSLIKPGGKIIISTHNPVNEYLRLSDDYLKIEYVEDTWKFGEKLYTMNYYTRSIQETLMPLIESGFELNKVLEPKPKDILKEKDLKTYQKLTKKAGFLFIEGIRK